MADEGFLYNSTNVTMEVADLHYSLNAAFLVLMGIIVFLMQGGFAFLEAGSVRSKNTVNIITKNMLDCLVAGIAYWAIGWGVAYGPNGNAFVGGSNFFAYGLQFADYPKWFFQYTFAATTATIVSGSIAERCEFGAYFVYSISITGWVYPVVSHWVWDESGWLFQIGYRDFAGSSVVHASSGVCALIATYLIGPRKGRYDENGNIVDMPGHSVPMIAIGGFVLLFGFLAFNGGSQGAIATVSDADIVVKSVVNTILGGSSGGLGVLFLYRFFGSKRWSYLISLNGTLAGMVIQCAGCDVYYAWEALLLGFIGGVSYLMVHYVVLKLKLDDPLDAVAVHFGGGTPGILLYPVFVPETGILWAGNHLKAWNQFGINLGGFLVMITWTSFWSLAIFYPLKYFGQLRIDTQTEFKGCDTVKHGELAYPAEAWVELQYRRAVSVPDNMMNLCGSFSKGKVKHNESKNFAPNTSEADENSLYRSTEDVGDKSTIPEGASNQGFSE